MTPTTTPTAADELRAEAIEAAIKALEPTHSHTHSKREMATKAVDAILALKAPTLPVPVKEIEERFKWAFEGENKHALPFRISDSAITYGTIFDANEMTVGTIFDSDVSQLVLALLNAWPALSQLHAGAWSGWQDIREQTPEPSQHVLLFQPGKAVVVGYLSEVIGTGWRTCPGDHRWKPTHWMKLPDAPTPPSEGE